MVSVEDNNDENCRKTPAVSSANWPQNHTGVASCGVESVSNGSARYQPSVCSTGARVANCVSVKGVDGVTTVSVEDWRCHLLLLHYPGIHLPDMLRHWRLVASSASTHLDTSEPEIGVPDPEEDRLAGTGLWWRHLVSGAAAGSVSRTVTAPLDRLKVFLQVETVPQPGAVRRCLRHMLHEGGVRSLWRGNGINVLKIAPESALKFMAYEYAKRGIRQLSSGSEERELLLVERLAAGSAAGAFSQSLIYPLEVLKTRLALRRTGQYSGVADAFSRIYRTEGASSFYRGFVPNLLGIIPYAGIELAVYETLKQRFLAADGSSEEPAVPAMLLCAATSSTCGQVASYPLALIRTRLQASGRPSGLWAQLLDIIQREGPSGLYRGFAPNFMKVAPAVSISYVVYEKCRTALGVEMT